MADANPLLMPKLGLTMTEGLLASWQVAVGDAVKAGDILFVVETDKISTEIEARGDGVIVSLDVAEGETVPVGEVLGRWTGASSAEQEAPAVEQEPAGEQAEAPSDIAPPSRSQPGARVRATPLARRMAAQQGIDLGALAGSGPGGRVKAIDVERAQGVIATASATAPAPYPSVSTGAPTRRPANRIEQIVARRLTESKQTIPHFYAFADVDLTDLLAMRRSLNTDPAAPASISVTHLLLAALARALAADPALNARWDDGEIVQFASVDIGLAVATDAGLLVPVLRGADRLGLDALAAAAGALVDHARAGRLAANALEGGAISISNVGMFGADALAPIINPGQSAILGVGRPKPVFRPDAAGQPALRQEVQLILSCDHRIYDGVSAAKLLDRLRGLVENPLRLLRS